MQACVASIAVGLVAIFPVACTATTAVDPPNDSPHPGDYRRPAHLSALGIDVTLVKTTREYIAIFPDGSRIAAVSAFEKERAAWRSRFGVLSNVLAAHLEKVGPQEDIPVMIMFDPQVDWSSLTPRLSSRDDVVRTRALRELSDAVGRRGEGVRQAVSAAGITKLQAFPAFPGLIGAGRRTTLQAVARLASVTSVSGADTARAHANSSGLGLPQRSDERGVGRSDRHSLQRGRVLRGGSKNWPCRKRRHAHLRYT